MHVLLEYSDAKDNVEDGFGICGHILIALSHVIFFLTLPLSLFVGIKIVSGTFKFSHPIFYI